MSHSYNLIQNNFAYLATCNMNQWSLDFKGNKENIVNSIKIAKYRKCTIRVGSELEIPGYGCEDHFLEQDTIDHSWEILCEILDGDLTNDIICVIGMPVIHQSVLYNCSIVCLNKQIILIRPKMALADDGNYREGRFFTRWSKNVIENHQLPNIITQVTNQTLVPFGNAIIVTNDTKIGIETCEELWQPQMSNIDQGLNGVEIFINNSGSHFELRKSIQRIKLLESATLKNGGVYIYSNQRGCDGGRLYFDGQSMIMQNGQILKTGSQFGFKDVEVVSSFVDLQAVRNHRILSKSRAVQSQASNIIHKINVDFEVARHLFVDESNLTVLDYKDIIRRPEEEIGLSTACWLWDYLRRSGSSGFFLPLSGGADSAATASIIYIMCNEIFKNIQQTEVLKQLQQVVRDQTFIPKSSQEIVKKLFYTSYMGTENSSIQTKQYAQDLADQIGSNHIHVDIGPIFKAFKDTIGQTFKRNALFEVEGGSRIEDIALQNIQARSRMIFSYVLAQLIPSYQMNTPGFLLVLGSSNIDEGLRGYFTKYDCSSADLNPIGSFSKKDLKQFLLWVESELKISSLSKIMNAIPTAELKPLDKNSNSYTQADEDDMGMTYAELSIFGQLRKIFKCGPVSMFKKLVNIWNNQLSIYQISLKVKHFFKCYAINRHKATTLTPSMHAENYSNEDNRFDLRPFLYNTNFQHQFENIDYLVKQLEANEQFISKL